MTNHSSFNLSVDGNAFTLSASDGAARAGWFWVEGAAPETGTAQAAPRESTFRRVEGGGETTNGSVLLVEAYVALWIILFAFLFISWRRQSRIDERVAQLESSFSRLNGSK
jgi:hypothetical protein